MLDPDCLKLGLNLDVCLLDQWIISYLKKYIYMCIGEGTYSECQCVVIITRRTHLSKIENMSLITMPYNMTLKGGCYLSCYKTGRNITEH